MALLEQQGSDEVASAMIVATLASTAAVSVELHSPDLTLYSWICGDDPVEVLVIEIGIFFKLDETFYTGIFDHAEHN